VQGGQVKEIILATNATLEGQTTAHYLTTRLAEFNLSISRLAQGIPMGGELDYLDDGTLGAALKARLPF
jgi:recombination protein RecR